MGELTNIETGQLFGSPGKPYVLSADPSITPGYAAPLDSIAVYSGVYFQKYNTTDTDWRYLTGASSYPTDEDYYKFRASYLMKSPRMTCWWWNDCLEPLSESFISTGTFTARQNPCGVFNVTQAAGSTSTLRVGNEAGTVTGNFIPGGTDGVWYMAYRARMSGADVKCYSEMWAANFVTGKYILFGDGSDTTTLFSLAYDGSANVFSAVANDELVHVHELIRVNGITTYYLDGVSIISGANYFSTGNGALRFRIGNTAGSTTPRSFDLDWVCAAVGGNNTRIIT
jgi:hypothetical protein